MLAIDQRGELVPTGSPMGGFVVRVLGYRELIRSNCISD
jgi:hypothetical protein